MFFRNRWAIAGYCLLSIVPTVAMEIPGVVDKTSDVAMPDGFRLEQIYSVPKDQGSWVAITMDDHGRFYCSDQHGGLYRVTVDDKASPVVSVEPVAEGFMGAHGLLWHRGVLWAAVGERYKKSGIWRIDDSDGDGTPDAPSLVREARGVGEHAVHSLVASPDGEMIYVVAGNHSNLPAMESSLVPRVWQEDHLLPRNPDARGHARGRMAPGGWVARFSADAPESWELFSIGYRNSFDAAFNEHGDLFVYDSDMEWDLGMPWYRPTRFCHALPGSEYGWRNGTGKWPDDYEDSLPGVADIGPGSPTGMVSGKGAKFPERYQRAVFGLDWTFATIYALHTELGDHGYTATAEEFMSGKRMPLTDGMVGADGALYFLTGGRRTGSAMWRIVYQGSAPVAPVVYKHKPLDLLELSQASKLLGSHHRFERYAARTALEARDPALMRKRLASGNASPWEVIGCALGLARAGTAEDAPAVAKVLCGLDWEALDGDQQLAWLRAIAVLASRHGDVVAGAREAVLAVIDASYPSKDERLNRELCRVLCYFQSPGVVGRTLALMDRAGPAPPPDWLELAERNDQYGKTVKAMIGNMPPLQVIHYAYCLRIVKGSWAKGQRKRYHDWLARLSTSKGGNSYVGFIKQIQRDALETCTPEERKELEKALDIPVINPFANLPRIDGPGRQWTVDEVVGLAKDLDAADRAKGGEMYRAALCAACHRHDGNGGSVGPDLSQVAGRFSARDLAVAMIQPSETISDQFAFDTIEMRDGSSYVGKIIGEKDLLLLVATNPYDMTQTIEVESSLVKQVKPSPVSPMPPGLINRMNADELKALLGYLLGD